MVAIIILNYNSLSDTIQCVQSIRSNTDCAYKIFIVDNCSSDNSYAGLENSYIGEKDIQLIKCSENKGYSAGNNVGIQAAIQQGFTEFIITNSDVEFKHHAIDILYDRLISHNNIGVIGPKVLNHDGTIQHYCKNKMTVLSYIMTKKPFLYLDFCKCGNRLYNKNYHFDFPFVFNGIVSGCCFGIKKEVFDSQGLLDENIFLYYEEDILGEKLRRIPLETMIEPESVVIHYGSRSVGNSLRAFPRMHRFYSAVYYLKNYTKANKFQIWLVKKFNLFLYGFKAIFNKEFKKRLKELKQLYKKL